MGRVGTVCPRCARIGCTIHRGTRSDRTSAQQHARTAAVAAHASTLGGYCPGTATRPAHRCKVAELTADHVLPRAHGGELGTLTVRCRACNSSRAAG